MNILIKLAVSLLKLAHPNIPSITARTIGRLSLFVIATVFSLSANAANYTWPGNNNSVHSNPTSACQSIASNDRVELLGVKVWDNGRQALCEMRNPACPWCEANLNIFRSGDSCPAGAVYNVTTGICEEPEACPGDSTRGPNGECALECPLGSVPDPATMKCKSICPDGKFWNFETESCKYPEDENCPTGSNWNPATKDCVCDGDGVLSNISGFRMCFPPADGECTKDSPDFVGYYNGLKPFCNGRARCPPGTTLGSVGSGDNVEHICLPDFGKDPDCPDGQSGVKDGKKVCLPKPGKDPDCPSGQSGMVGGKKVCLPKPGDPGDCKEGETPGFVGKGDTLEATCVPSNYKPDTCPAGSYSINQKTGGFACVTLGDGKKPGTDGGESGPEKGGSKDPTVVGGGTTKDKDGNKTGEFDINMKLPEGLLLDQPTTDYKKETDEFGDAELAKLDEQSKGVVDDFMGDDGAFTERAKLDSAQGYLLGIFGYSTSCSGGVTFWNSPRVQVTCDKVAQMKRILGWLLYVTTAFSIFNILTRKNED